MSRLRRQPANLGDDAATLNAVGIFRPAKRKGSSAQISQLAASDRLRVPSGKPRLDLTVFENRVDESSLHRLAVVPEHPDQGVDIGLGVSGRGVSLWTRRAFHNEPLRVLKQDLDLPRLERLLLSHGSSLRTLGVGR